MPREKASASNAKDARITFSAVVYKVQTLADGGLRITLDLPETAIPQAAMLMECKREEIPLRFEAGVAETADIETVYGGRLK
ncbi:MAG: hypothetical protein WC455_14410 [Dehalococcoidia bacterium]|jgi:hypothetical protein